MRRASQILSVCVLLMGVALVAVGLYPDPWPLSLQLLGGVCMIVFGALRLRYF